MSLSVGKRPRFSGSVADVVAKLKPVVRSRGRRFIVWDDNEHVAKAKVVVANIEKASPVLAALRECDLRLGFTKSFLELVLRQLYEELQSEKSWAMDEKWITGWVKTMKCRIMNCCHAIRENEAAKRPPKWVAELPWFVDDGRQLEDEVCEQEEEEEADEQHKEDDEEERGEAAAPAAKRRRRISLKRPAAIAGAEQTFVYGFQKDLRVAWRVPTHDVQDKSKREAASQHSLCDDDAAVLASWPDGHTHKLAGITADDMNPKKKSSAVLWSGEHIRTKCLVEVKHKKDRHEWGYVMLHLQKQVVISLKCQLCESMQAAHEIMISLAKQLCKGDIRQEDLKSRLQQVVDSHQTAQQSAPKQMAKKPAHTSSPAPIGLISALRTSSATPARSAQPASSTTLQAARALAPQCKASKAMYN